MAEPKDDLEYGTFEPHKGIHSNEDSTLGNTWMSQIDDDTLISDLTIPGTHDSAAYTYPIPFIQTQTLDINHQLALGIRYFDLRCGLDRDELQMVHGPTLLRLTLRSVLDTLHAFLTTHPSEALIIQIKKDRATSTSTLPFSTALHTLLTPYPIHTSPTIPPLSHLRGRILLFRRFALPPPLTPYGIDVTPWPDNPPTAVTITTPSASPAFPVIQLTLQDHYLFTALPLPALLHEKTHAVTTLFDLAQTNADPRHFYLNFASASEISVWYRYSPREVAVGAHFGWKWVGGVNGRVREWVGENYGRRRLGIVVLDFVGEGEGEEGVVGLLIRSNALKGQRVRWRKGLWWLMVVGVGVGFGVVVGAVYLLYVVWR